MIKIEIQAKSSPQLRAGTAFLPVFAHLSCCVKSTGSPYLQVRQEGLSTTRKKLIAEVGQQRPPISGAPIGMKKDRSRESRTSMAAMNEHGQTPHAYKLLDAFRNALQTDPFIVRYAADKTFRRHVTPPVR
jgi:hypothetical protein